MYTFLANINANMSQYTIPVKSLAERNVFPFFYPSEAIAFVHGEKQKKFSRNGRSLLEKNGLSVISSVTSIISSFDMPPAFSCGLDFLFYFFRVIT